MSILGFGVVGSTFLCLGSTCAALSGFCIFQEIAEVNRKLPDNMQISYWGKYPGKISTIKEQYERLYPNGRLEYWRMAFQIAMFIFVGLVLVSGGPFKQIWESIHSGSAFLPICH
jgi:hypothetical protein